MNIIIMDPNYDYSNALAEKLTEYHHTVAVVHNGKEAQLKLSKAKFDLAIISSELRDFSSFEVLKYIRTTSLGTKVCFFLENEDILNDFTFDLRKGHINLGINRLLLERVNQDRMCEEILSLLKNKSWTHIKNTNPSTTETSEEQVPDAKMTSVDSSSFENDNIAIFDLYIRLGTNKYIKILKKGDFFERERIKKLRSERKVTELFFKTQDRIIFINFFNQKITKISKTTDSKVSLNYSKELSSKIVEEIYTQGLDHDLVEECVDHTDAVFRQIEKQDKLMSLFTDLMDKIEGKDHAFSVSFISFIIAKNIPWVTERTLNIIGLSSLLHDIGKLKLDKKLLEKSVDSMEGSELHEYRKHPLYGVQMLDGASYVNEAVKQVVYQHHEYVNGTGYPLGISGHKIFYPTKIISLSNYLVDSIEKGIKPRESLKNLLNNKDELEKFDTDVLRLFIKGVI